MKTTTNNSKADTKIADETLVTTREAGSLSLTDFNREHGDEIRRIAEASKRYQDAQRVNRIFEIGTIVLLLTTAGAGAIDLLTMLAR